MDLAGADLQVETAQNLLVVHGDAQVLDLQHAFLESIRVWVETGAADLGGLSRRCPPG